MLFHVSLSTGARWGPEESTLCPAARTKAAQLGQKLSMGLEAAYQVIIRVHYFPNFDGDTPSFVVLVVVQTLYCLPTLWRKTICSVSRGKYEVRLTGIAPCYVMDTFCYSVDQTCSESCSRSTRGDFCRAMRPETWKRFVDRLARSGFFEGELEGSKRYREKTSMAEVRYNRLSWQCWCPPSVWTIGHLPVSLVPWRVAKTTRSKGIAIDVDVMIW